LTKHDSEKIKHYLGKSWRNNIKCSYPRNYYNDSHSIILADSHVLCFRVYKHHLLWAILTFFVAMLPMIGTTIIWIPLTLIAFVRAIMGNDVSMIIVSVVGFIWGSFVANVDNVLRPAIIGRQGNIHPLMILIGILGGIKVFGIAGIFVGPVILTAAFLFIEMFLIVNEKTKESTETIPLKKKVD
jgi:predicted PurR-regulated permease PerM